MAPLTSGFAHKDCLVGCALGIEQIPAAVVFAASSSKPLNPAYRYDQAANLKVRLSLLGMHPISVKEKPCRAQGSATLNDLV
jgi:hypothetical protein